LKRKLETKKKTNLAPKQNEFFGNARTTADGLHWRVHCELPNTKRSASRDDIVNAR
jgi:hypothetical protein